MAEEIVTILNVKTGEAVQSVADLRNNVKLLKDALKEAEEQSGTEEGWKDYQKTLEALKVNQAALKDAMYATSGSFDDVKKGAVGATQSYNSLVNKMADLKREFRSTGDEARRMQLGQQINEINDKLKEMDALQGNFQRNVGNYQSAFKGWAEKVDVLKKSLEAGTKGLGGLKDGMDGIAKSPAIASFGLIVSLVMKLADAVKDDEKATAALKKGMEALKPVMDFLSGILDKIVDVLVEIIGRVSEFLGSSGLINKIIKGVMGVGNAILQFIIAPFKGIIEAIKVFKEQGIGGFRDAAKAFGQEMKSGVSFKENFQTGQTIADTILSGVSSRKKKAQDTGKKLGEEAGKKFAEQMLKTALDALKRRESYEASLRDAMKTWQDALNDVQKESDKEMQEWIDEDFNYQLEALKKELEEEEKLRQEDLEKQKKIAEAKKALLKGVASATSDILGSIADMYESDEEGAKKNAEKIKALRIAAATIDTISGAIGAFMQASATYPPPYGQILGAIEAAAITASGVAQIAKMKSTSVTDGNARPTTSAVASAPTISPNVTQVRSVTSASEEDRLNRMASDHRVYILSSDIEASQNQIKTQVSESSF